MASLQPQDAGSSTVSITILSITPMRAGRLFALAAVQIDIDGAQIEIHGIRAMHVHPASTRIELPMFRDAGGASRPAIILPEEVRGPIGNIVLDAPIDRGLAKPRFVAPMEA
jgi:stage V sporulation protein G